MINGRKAGAIGVTIGLLLGAGAIANVPDDAANPYQGILSRNVFALNPIPPPGPPPAPPKPPPPDIKLTGITTINGVKQALLKLPAKPPKHPKDEYYILTEGQRDGDIEMVRIDEKAGAVTIKNNGVTQKLDFENNGLKLPSGPAAGAVASIPRPGRPGQVIRRIPGRPLRVPTPGVYRPTTGGNSTPGYSGSPGYAGTGAGQSQSGLSFTRRTPGFTRTPDYGLTADQQTVLIEANRAKLLDEGRKDEAAMLPPTPLTKQLEQPQQMPQ